MYQHQQRPQYASGLFSGASVGRNDAQRASAASLFSNGFNQNLPLNNQPNQFDSFVNDAQQSQNFMSLPPEGNVIASPPTYPQNRSGPPSLSNVGNTSNPFRAQGRRGHSTKTPNKASSLFGNPATADGFTPVSFAPSNSSHDYLNNPPDVTASFSSMPNIMPIQQPQGYQNELDKVVLHSVDMVDVANLSALYSKDPDDSPVNVKCPWKFDPVGKRFSEYPSSDISEDKRRKAELENDQLRAQKIANREQNLAKVNEKREAMIKSQNDQWEQIEKEKEQQAIMSSFTNEKAPLDMFQKQYSPANKVKKPLTKEERKEMRDRAKQIRMKRSDRANHAAGDLGSLYDEISSRGASVCSDLSDKHQSTVDGFHQRTDPTGMIPHPNFSSSNHLYHVEPVSNIAIMNPSNVVDSNTSAENQFFDGQQYQQNNLDYGMKSTDVPHNVLQPSNEQARHPNQNTEQLLNKVVNSEDNSSGSSYDLVGQKSSGSESRLSPYELVDKMNYPSQSSLNSNDSSPLEFIQNVSVTSSTYEKVSAPSSSMSFDMGSVETNRSSANEGPLQIMPNLTANSKPSNEPLNQQVEMFSPTHGEVTLPPTSASVISDIPTSTYFSNYSNSSRRVPVQNMDIPANSNITTIEETLSTQHSVQLKPAESHAAMLFQPQIPEPVVNQLSNPPQHKTSQQFMLTPQNLVDNDPSYVLTNSPDANKQTLSVIQSNATVNSAAMFYTSPNETSMVQPLSMHQNDEQFPLQSTSDTKTEERIPEAETKLLTTQTIETSSDQNLYYNQNDSYSVQSDQFLRQVQNPLDASEQTALVNVNSRFLPQNPVNDIHQETTHLHNHNQITFDSRHHLTNDQSHVFAQSPLNELSNDNSKLSVNPSEQFNPVFSSNYQPSIGDHHPPVSTLHFNADFEATQTATSPRYSTSTSSAIPQPLHHENLHAATSPNMVMSATASIPQYSPHDILDEASSLRSGLMQQASHLGSESAKLSMDGQPLSGPTETSVLSQDKNIVKNSQSDAFMFFKSEKQTDEKPVLVSSNPSFVSRGQQVAPHPSLSQHQLPQSMPTQLSPQSLEPQLRPPSAFTSQETLQVSLQPPMMSSQVSSQHDSMQSLVSASPLQPQLPVEQPQTLQTHQQPQPMLQQPQMLASQPALTPTQPPPPQHHQPQQLPQQPMSQQSQVLASQPVLTPTQPPPQQHQPQQQPQQPMSQQPQMLPSQPVLTPSQPPPPQQHHLQQAATTVNQFQAYGQMQTGFPYQHGTTPTSSSLPYAGQTLSSHNFSADFQYSQAPATIMQEQNHTSNHPTDTTQANVNSMISSPEQNAVVDPSGLQTQASNFMQPTPEQSLAQQQYQPYSTPYGQNYNDIQQQMYWQHYHQQQMWYANYYNQQQYYDQYQHYGYHPYWGMDPNYDQYSYHSSAASSMYGDSRPGSVIERRSSGTEDQILNELADLTSEMSFQNRPETPPQEELIPRTTPLSFTRPHVKARFSLTAGIISIVAPKQPLDGEVAFIQNIPVANIAPNILLTRFPGPLVRKETHKKHVRNFIMETIRDHLPRLHTDPIQLFSHVALWEFVNLLVKQNGTFDGSDVADLLVNLLPVTEINGIESRGLSTLANPPQNVSSDELEEFHTYISTGRTRDAVDIAIRSGLWGHAFMLSYSLGEKWASHVQNRFLMGLRKTDPMKTLYAHLQNKDISYIKKRANPETWVQNLCVLISQASNKPDRDKEKIVVFGDALREQGLIAAAQLCYLVAKILFGKHTCKDERLVLLGLDHQHHTGKPSRRIAKDLSVQLTEIYQYALTLHDQSYVIPSFQLYKFDYAMQLIECGYSSEGLAYLESIGIAINNDRTYSLYKSEFVRKLVKMAEQLFLLEVDKYEELEEIPWLRNLKSYSELSVNRVSPDGEAGFNKMIVSGRMCSSTNLSDPVHANLTSPEPLTDWSAEGSSNELSSRNGYADNSNQHEYNDIYSVKHDASESYTLGKQPFQHGNEFGQTEYPNHGFDSTDGSYEPSPRTAIEPSSTNDTYESNSRPSSSVYPTNAYDYTDYGYTHPVDSTNPAYDDQQGAQGLDQPDQQYQYQNSENNMPGQFEDSGYQGTNNANQLTHPYYSGEQYNQATTAPPSFFNPAQFTNAETASDMYSYDNQYGNPEESRRESFTTNDKPYEEEEEVEDLFGDFTKKKNTQGGVPTSNVSKNDAKPKPEPAKANEAKEKKGIVGYFLSKFSRGKEVHLPDDKDKSLVYDEKLQRWVDKDADSTEESKPLPPPPPMAISQHVNPPSMDGDRNIAPPMFGTPSMNDTPQNAPEAIVPPVQQMERTSAKQAAREAMIARRNSRNNMAARQAKSEEEKKPSGPPSKFSLKAQGGRRGTGRYINVMGSATKSTPMAPVLDPFSGLSTPNSGKPNQLNQPGGNNMPMTFFDPSKMSNPSS